MLCANIVLIHQFKKGCVLYSVCPAHCALHGHAQFFPCQAERWLCSSCSSVRYTSSEVARSETGRSFITALWLSWAINHTHIIVICLKTQEFDFISFNNPPRRRSSLSSLWLIRGQWRTPLQVQTTLRKTQCCKVEDLPASLTTRQDCSSCRGINTVVCHRLHIHWDFSDCFWFQSERRDSSNTWAFTTKSHSSNIECSNVILIQINKEVARAVNTSTCFQLHGLFNI